MWELTEELPQMGFLLCNGICVRMWSKHKNSGGFAPEKLHKMG